MSVESPPRRWRVVLPLAVLAVLAACGPAGPSDRQTEVAERGSRIMPFDLEATTHHFDSDPDGLTQTVVVDDPTDTDQLALVRTHLQDEADRFASGDFDDPAHIHGDAMPGLSDLRAGYAAIDVTYSDLPDGARITYRTTDPALVDALHTWGAAQIADHGAHAEH
ncbi:MAG TPA: hypothetical protein VH479_04010 [Acidimicrobiales bacterium]